MQYRISQLNPNFNNILIKRHTFKKAHEKVAFVIDPENSYNTQYLDTQGALCPGCVASIISNKSPLAPGVGIVTRLCRQNGLLTNRPEPLGVAVGGKSGREKNPGEGLVIKSPSSPLLRG